MTRKDIIKLLGGYATNTLTEEERATLYAAALEDQELFDALADEQALRDLLADAGTRARLRAALGERRAGAAAALAAWWRRPAAALLAGGIGVGLMALAILRVARPPAAAPTMQIAVLRTGPIAPPPAPATIPPPAAPEALPEHRAAKALKKEAPAPVIQPAPQAAEKTREPKQLTGAINGPPTVAEIPPPPPLPTAQDTRSQVTVVLPPPQQAPAAVLGGVPAVPSAQAFAPAPPPPPREEAATRMRPVAGFSTMRADTAGKVARASLVAQPRPLLTGTVMREGEGGRFEALPRGEAVHTGERIRLEIASPVSGWVYLVERGGAEGSWKVTASGAVAPGKPFRYPAAGSLRLEAPGRRQWYVVFSAGPGANLAGAPPPDALAIGVDATNP